MAREIKFRVWYTSINSFYIYGTEAIRLLITTPQGFNCEFEQYTGLKDTNGTEIYENDIVQFKDDHFGDNENHYGIIEYSEYAELVIGNIMLSRVFQAVEVIGNIHENSELLGD